ncbi:MAG: YfhO family protein [Bacteroidales bacterium]
MKDLRPKQFMPYLAAIIIFFILSIAYVSPVLEGKLLMQPDIVNWQGMAKEIIDFRGETGEEPLWTNSMFGGMPAFQISVQWTNNIAGFFHDAMTLWLPRPADMIFLYFAGFFIFMLLLRVNPWIALAGSLAFALSSYHFIILEAGHNSKAVAIGYMAPVMGAILYTFRGHLWGGGLLFAIFMGLQLFANHFQITYYLGLIVAIYGAIQLYEHVREKQTTAFLKKFGVLLAGLIIAAGINIGNLWGTYSYTSETMRGGTELTIGDQTSTGGLSKEYITNWSYGIEETFSLLIPNAKGGATGPLKEHDKALEAVDQGYQGIVGSENSYWGNQPFTSGPVYAGAVVLFFFFLSLFYVRGPLKWGLLAAIILSVMLAWGKNFMPLTDFFINYVPGYDKFRAVSMTLVIAEFCIPALAFLGMYKLWTDPSGLSIKSQPFLTALGFTAGLSLLFYIAPAAFLSFTSRMENQAFSDMIAQQPSMSAQIQQVIQELEKARIALFRADALRSFLFAAGAGLFTLLFAYKKIGRGAFVTLIILLLVADMWPVNRRYLNDDHFQRRRVVERPYPLRTADEHILQDEDHFRVLDISENTFNSARTAYHHHAIGGYHGAKLQRYQDLIDFYLQDHIQELVTMNNDQEAVELLADKPVLNMLNTRYVIYDPEGPPLLNPHALGDAWLVDEFRVVENSSEELMALEELDPADTAIVHQQFADLLEGKTFRPDPDASIRLTHYEPNELVYDYQADSEQLAVFSEIYYPEGWEVKINDTEAEHFRVNYILRGMVLPEGAHTITFSFRPAPYYTGRYIALAFSIIMAAGIAAYAWIQFRRIRRRKQVENSDHS